MSLVIKFCTHDETSNKELFPTFARTRPPDTQISKSVASVLKKFRWHKVACKIIKFYKLCYLIEIITFSFSSHSRQHRLKSSTRAQMIRNMQRFASHNLITQLLATWCMHAYLICPLFFNLALWWLQIAQTVVTTLASENIEVKFKRTWKSTYHHGWESWMANPFEKMVDETYQDIRSKFLLYSSTTHTTVYPLMKGLVLLFDEKQYKFRHC